MKVNVKDRKTATVTKLVKGDIITEDGQYFEVTSLPENRGGTTTVALRKVDGTNKTRARRYDYNSATRFNLVK